MNHQPVVIVVRHPDHSNEYRCFGDVRTFDMDLGRADLSDADERAEWVEHHAAMIAELKADGRHDAAAYMQSVVDNVVTNAGIG